MKEKVIEVGKIRDLLDSDKKVSVETEDGNFTEVTDFIEKGVLPTYRVSTKNGNSIKVSSKHLFFTDQGWMTTEDLVVGKSEILCKDDSYSVVQEVSHIGDREIFDITVGHPKSCYYAEGMMHHNSGKSLLASHIVANTQKEGGISVYIDTENALKFDFLETIGVDRESKSFIYVPENRLEKIFEIMEDIIVKVKNSSDEDRFITIVLDSVAGATTQKEYEADYTKDGYATDKAIIFSKALRKITNMVGREKVLLVLTNQIRDNVGGGPWTKDWRTPGGNAIPHHTSVRIQMKGTKKIKAAGPRGKQIVGAKLRPFIQKNRLGPPKRGCEFDLLFDRGIDDVGSILAELKNIEAIQHKGAGWYNLYVPNEDGEYEEKWSHPDEEGDDPFSFREDDFREAMKNDEDFREIVFENLHRGIIVDYDDNWADTSETEYVENGEETEEE